MVAVGVLLAVLALLVGYAGVPGVVLTAGVLLAVVLVVGLALALGRPVWVLRVDETGYRVRFVRGAGVARAPWADVEAWPRGEAGGSRVLVLDLRDGAAHPGAGRPAGHRPRGAGPQPCATAWTARALPR